jgi:hypothetical protein
MISWHEPFKPTCPTGYPAQITHYKDTKGNQNVIVSPISKAIQQTQSQKR